MRQFILAGLMALALIAGGVFEAGAQEDSIDIPSTFGVGVKAPPIPIPALFVAYHLSEMSMIEASGSLRLGADFSYIALAAIYKQFLDNLRVENVPVTPFLGVGASIYLSSSAGLAIFGVAGLEYAINGTPLSAFLEGGAGVTVLPRFNFQPNLALGLRLDF